MTYTSSDSILILQLVGQETFSFLTKFLFRECMGSKLIPFISISKKYFCAQILGKKQKVVFFWFFWPSAVHYIIKSFMWLVLWKRKHSKQLAIGKKFSVMKITILAFWRLPCWNKSNFFSYEIFIQVTLTKPYNSEILTLYYEPPCLSNELGVSC